MKNKITKYILLAFTCLACKHAFSKKTISLRSLLQPGF